MALAYLKFVGMDEREAEFEADTGTNTFYQYIIGKEKSTSNGLETIEDVTHISGIFENGPFNAFKSAFALKVPAQLLNRQQRYIQLRSYKTRDSRAIAMSKIIEVYPQINYLPEELPSIAAQQSLNDPKKERMSLPVNCRSVGFSFTESRLSTPMFWQAILDVARLLAPQVVSGISNITTSGQPNSATNEEIVRIINSVIDVLRNNGSRPTQPAPSVSPHSTAAAQPQAHSIFHKRYYAQQNTTYSNQMFAPLAGLIPLLMQNLPAIGSALGPLIQNLPQVIGPIMERAPQLLQTVADSPIRLMNALAEFSARQRELNIQNKQADQGHIERILADINRNLLMQQLLRDNPGTSLPDLSAIPATPAEALPPAASASSLSSIRGESTPVAISIQKNNPITVNGKPKHLYSNREGIKLLLQVRAANSTDKISRAIATLLVKNSMNRQLYLEKKFRLKDLASNSIQELELLPNEVQALPKNIDLIASVSLRYITKNNSTADGGTDVHMIYLTDDYFIKSFGDKAGDEIPLTDRNKYRTFWNKVWEGGTKTKKRWELNIDAKYYICFKYDKDSNGRIETRIKKLEKDEESDYREYISGMLKSGMEISPVALNMLLQEISSYAPLSEQQLKALQTDELSSTFNSEAIAHLEMKGRDEEAGYLWVFPEVCVYRLLLQKAETVDANGQITKTTEENVYFPKITSVHFLGEKSK